MTYTSKAAQKRDLETLNREYSKISDEMSTIMLEGKTVDDETHPLYWEKPYNLHEFTAKRVEQFKGEFPEQVARIQILSAKRIEIKNTEIVKAAPVKKSRATENGATHDGICQICNRPHAFNKKTGKIAQHGYTVEYGFFNGVCAGSDEQPLQNDRTIADKMILQLTSASRSLNAQIQKGSTAIKHIRRSHRDDNKLFTAETWSETDMRFNYYRDTWGEAQQRELKDMERRAMSFREFAIDIACRADEIFSTPLTER